MSPGSEASASRRTGARSWIGELLDFARDGDLFTAPTPAAGEETRLFGGLIAAQALGAAGATVDDDKQPHSLHAYFLRGGRYGVDATLHVHRVRDGASFATRRVTVAQNGTTIFEMLASFHRPEPSVDHYPAAEPVPTLTDSTHPATALAIATKFEIRSAIRDPSGWAIPPFWIRSREAIENDPLIRACTLTFLSDIGPVPVARPPGTPLRSGTGFAASLDHAVWFHRPFEPGTWHRYDVTAVNHGNARGLVRGSLYDATGRLIASTGQEALWRL